MLRRIPPPALVVRARVARGLDGFQTEAGRTRPRFPVVNFHGNMWQNVWCSGDLWHFCKNSVCLNPVRKPVHTVPGPRRAMTGRARPEGPQVGEMGGAPSNPAPRNHFLVRIVKPSGCHCTAAFGWEKAYRRVPTPLRSTSPFSDRGSPPGRSGPSRCRPAADKAVGIHGSKRGKTVFNPTGGLFSSDRDLRKSPETYGRLQDNVI